MRHVGIDLHRDFAQVAYLQNGKLTGQRRVLIGPDHLRAFAKSLGPEDHVVMESTSFVWPVYALLEKHAGSVTVSNPMQTRAISWAKVKSDKVDAAMLAKLLAAGMIAPVWAADDETRMLRYKVAHRSQIVRHRTRVRNQASSVLQRNLIKPKISDSWGTTGRAWMQTVELPTHERIQLDSLIRLNDMHCEELKIADAELSGMALDLPAARLLMTIPGVGPHTALALLSSIGDITRFPSPRHLVGYLGLDPKVRQSGNGPYRMGSISKHGDAHTRNMLTEAAWAAVRVPGPLRAFYQRLRQKKATNVALVAVARKMTIIAHHMLTTGETFRYQMPSLTERKLRRLEDAAGREPKHSQSAYQHRRHQEREVLEAHKRAYQTHANERSRKKR